MCATVTSINFQKFFISSRNSVSLNQVQSLSTVYVEMMCQTRSLWNIGEKGMQGHVRREGSGGEGKMVPLVQ